MRDVKIRTVKVTVVLDIVICLVLLYLNKILNMRLLIWPRTVSFVAIIVIVGVIIYVSLLAIFVEQHRKKRDKCIGTGIIPLLKKEPKVVTYIGEETKNDEHKNIKYLLNVISRLSEKTGCYFEASIKKDDEFSPVIALVFVDEDGEIEEKVDLIKISSEEFVKNFAFVDFYEET